MGLISVIIFFFPKSSLLPVDSNVHHSWLLQINLPVKSSQHRVYLQITQYFLQFPSWLLICLNLDTILIIHNFPQTHSSYLHWLWGNTLRIIFILHGNFLFCIVTHFICFLLFSIIFSLLESPGFIYSVGFIKNQLLNFLCNSIFICFLIY